MTDQTAPLRDRIAAALYTHDHPYHVVPLDETGMGSAYRETADAVLAVLPAPADRAADLAAALAEDLRYVLDYRGPGHAHERPGFWDTSGRPCMHCARLAVARMNLADHDAELRRVADETATAERPACPHCGLPHVAPSMELACASIRASIRDRGAAWGVCQGCGAAAGPDCDCPPFAEQPAVGARQDGARP